MKSFYNSLLAWLYINPLNDLNQLSLLVIKPNVNALLPINRLRVFGGSLIDRELVEFVVSLCVLTLNLIATDGLEPSTRPFI